MTGAAVAAMSMIPAAAATQPLAQTMPLSFMNMPILTYIAEISPRPVLFIHGEKPIRVTLPKPPSPRPSRRNC